MKSRTTLFRKVIALVFSLRGFAEVTYFFVPSVPSNWEIHVLCSSFDLLSSFEQLTSPRTCNTSFTQGFYTYRRKLHLVLIVCCASNCPLAVVFS